MNVALTIYVSVGFVFWVRVSSYISSMQFTSTTSGFATSLNTEQQSGILKFSA